MRYQDSEILLVLGGERRLDRGTACAGIAPEVNKEGQELSLRKTAISLLERYFWHGIKN